MDSGLEAISLIADHAAVGAVFGAAWALGSGRREMLDVGIAGGMVAGAAWGVLLLVNGVQ